METASRMLPARTSAAVLCAPAHSSPESQAGGVGAGALFPPPTDAATDAQWQSAWTVRAERLEVMREAPSEEQRLWAIRTLAREAAFVQRRFLRTGEPLGEEYGAYYRRLGLLVAHLRDERAIEALAVAADIDPAVPDALAGFGEAAVDAVLRTLGNAFLREAAACTLGRILQRADRDRTRFAPPTMRAIRRSLAEAVRVGAPSLQRCALRALRDARLTDEEVRALRAVEKREDTAPAVRDDIRALLAQ